MLKYYDVPKTKLLTIKLKRLSTTAQSSLYLSSNPLS